jgi:hypothetical protein
MLPGFRFLFAAIVLSMSLLVFGLGAAALLRSAHEEFASNPSWRAAPEVKFAQQSEATMPVLATLSLDIREEQNTHGEAAADKAPAEPEVTASAPATPEQVAIIKPEQSSPPEAAKPEVTTPTPAKPETSLAANRQLASEVTLAPQKVASPEQPATAEQPEPESGQQPREESTISAVATIELSPRDHPPLAALPEHNAAEAPPAADGILSDLASTRIATLGGPPVDIMTPTKANEAKPDENATKKRAEARRAARRRRIAAARAQLAARQAQLHLLGGPFLQQPSPAARAR